MVRIVKSKAKDYDDMFKKCSIIELDKYCKAGDVIDERIILSGAIFGSLSDEYEKGTYVRAIPLYDIAIVDTDVDLSSYGFVKSEYSDRWFNTK